jgi:hypothetical protein
MTEKYNGWTNRETWVINLWLEEDLTQVVIDYCEDQERVDVYEITNLLEEVVNEWYMDELSKMSGVLKDLLYLSEVNWRELAKTYIDNITIDDSKF